MNEPKEILSAFIENETSALARGMQGTFWPDNHHRVSPLIARAPKILDVASLGMFYFHLLRHGDFPVARDEPALQAIVAAYRQTLPWLTREFRATSLPRLVGLLVFGFDDRCTLPEEPPLSLDHYKELVQHCRYMMSFSHVPGILGKQARFREISANDRILKRTCNALCLSRLSDYLPFPNGGPWLWSMVCLALQDPESGGAVVHKLVREQLSPEVRVTTFEVLRRCLVAAERTELLAVVDAADVRTAE